MFLRRIVTWLRSRFLRESAGLSPTRSVKKSRFSSADLFTGRFVTLSQSRFHRRFALRFPERFVNR